LVLLQARSVGQLVETMPELTAAPNRIPWPPILFGAAILAAVGMGTMLPWPEWLRGSIWSVLGGIVLLAGLTLDICAMVVMWRKRASILPNHAATTLVTSGPFAWSRNPIYLGNTIAMLGAALAFANPWVVPAALVAAFGVTRLAIEREEAHLAAQFGLAWEVYSRRTARWLGW